MSTATLANGTRLLQQTIWASKRLSHPQRLVFRNTPF